jgi:hypothetical protein
VVTVLNRWWNADALMCADAAISSNGDGLREMGAYPGHGFGNPVDSGLGFSDLGDTSTNWCPQQTNQDLVDNQRSEEI